MIISTGCLMENNAPFSMTVFPRATAHGRMGGATNALQPSLPNTSWGAKSPKDQSYELIHTASVPSQLLKSDIADILIKISSCNGL